MKIGKLSFILRREASVPRWQREVEGQYGLAITYWLREKVTAKWHRGLRFSLLLGSKRPFLRVTSYSCPMFGSADTVKIQDCVIPL